MARWIEFKDADNESIVLNMDMASSITKYEEGVTRIFFLGSEKPQAVLVRATLDQVKRLAEG